MIRRGQQPTQPVRKISRFMVSTIAEPPTEEALSYGQEESQQFQQYDDSTSRIAPNYQLDEMYGTYFLVVHLCQCI